jgi:iron complex outermembrane receptor protein
MNDRQFRVKPLWQAIGALGAATATFGSAPALGAAPGGGLEEIVVTATRREQSQQSVAIPMTAVSGDMLERAFAQDLRDLTAASPNVQLEPVGIFQNAASFFIRGQGTGDIESAADGKVAIFIDGAVQARVSTALGDFVDVEAVEILRGPQGTLFGRNTVAGAVLLRHNAPELNEFGGSGGIQIGDFGRRDLKGVLNIPLVDDTLAARIAVKTTNLDGYWDNSAPNVNDDRGAIDRVTILPSLLWTPNENLEVIVRGEWNRTPTAGTIHLRSSRAVVPAPGALRTTIW